MRALNPIAYIRDGFKAFNLLLRYGRALLSGMWGVSSLQRVSLLRLYTYYGSYQLLRKIDRYRYRVSSVIKS